MKKVIYVSFLDESKLSGYKYKIHSQCSAINNIGFETYLLIISNGEVIFYRINSVNDEILFKKSENRRRFSENRNIFDEILLFKFFIKELIKVVKEIVPDFIYIRRILPITPLLIKAIKKIKNLGITVFYEYPTFPWENELLAEKRYLFYFLDKIQFKLLESVVSNFVVVGVDEQNFNLPYKVISNGIKVSDIPMVNKKYEQHNNINLIGVANVNLFHGFDRVINGLYNYYKKDNNPEVINFHIVGNIAKDLNLRELVEEYGLHEHVIFHGYKSGDELKDLFNEMQVGIGCLGVHRKKVTSLNSLKNREYAARGIPFVFSEKDYAIESKEPKFIFKPSFDDSPIEIEEIIDLYRNIEVEPEEIRRFATENLNWETEMKKVFIYEKENNDEFI